MLLGLFWGIMPHKQFCKLQNNDLWCPSDACVNQKITNNYKTVQTECKTHGLLFYIKHLEALSIMNALSHMHDDNTKENVNQWTDSYMNHFLTKTLTEKPDRRWKSQHWWESWIIRIHYNQCEVMINSQSQLV